MNPIVSAIGRLNIEGNIVPNVFFGAITSPRTGKPHLLAVMIMADIVYWYRPREIRDEVTGETREWRQKFKADLLQKSYNGYAALYGVSRGQAKEAFDLLQRLRLINVEFRNIITPDGQTLANVMFVEPVVANLERVLEGVVGKNGPRPPKKSTTWSEKTPPPPPKKRGTYTEITTEITTSSSTPPTTEEEEGVKKEKNPTALPTPFSGADKASQARLLKACRGKDIDPTELCHAVVWEYTQSGQPMREPIGAAMAKLAGGEVAETIAAWRQAQAISMEKKVVDIARRQAEEAEEKRALEKRGWHMEQARAAYEGLQQSAAQGGRA